MKNILVFAYLLQKQLSLAQDTPLLLNFSYCNYNVHVLTFREIRNTKVGSTTTSSLSFLKDP